MKKNVFPNLAYVILPSMFEVANKIFLIWIVVGHNKFEDFLGLIVLLLLVPLEDPCFHTYSSMFPPVNLSAIETLTKPLRISVKKHGLSDLPFIVIA